MTIFDKLRKATTIIQWRRRPEVLCHPHIPKPMHGMAPRLILGQEWWDRERRSAYASTCYHCVACEIKAGDDYCKVLEGHECYEVDYEAGRMTYVETIPLCHMCHSFIHYGRLSELFKVGKISVQEFDETTVHGEAVLKAAGLEPWKPVDGHIAEWNAWRLVLLGKEYPPHYHSYRDWLVHYRPEDKR